MNRFLIHIDAQDAQDFSGDGWIVVLGIRVAPGQAFEFEPAFAEIVEQSHLKPHPLVPGVIVSRSSFPS